MNPSDTDRNPRPPTTPAPPNASMGSWLADRLESQQTEQDEWAKSGGAEANRQVAARLARQRAFAPGVPVAPEAPETTMQPCPTN